MTARGCPKCGGVHCTADVQTLSPFAIVAGFRTLDGEVHESREAAQEWLCEQRQAVAS